MFKADLTPSLAWPLITGRPKVVFNPLSLLTGIAYTRSEFGAVKTDDEQ